MAKVEVQGLKKAYRDARAVRGLSFSVKDGEFFCLLGPPGAGKTTTFRIISGLESPDEGDVLIDGESVREVPPQRRDVAMVFEDMALYPHMSGFGNIAHPLYLQGVPEDEIERLVRSLMDQLQISHLTDRRPETFSGGERRRVALARALVRSPRALLLDQALSDLDAKIRQEMAGELKRIQRETGQTMIYATHDYEEAIAMGDRILVMRGGEELQTSGPDEVYWEPQSKFVAGFVGTPSMNFIPCRLKTRNGRVEIEQPAFQIGLDSPGTELPERALLGIRPEHVRLAGDAGSAGISAVVEIMQVLGEEMIVDFRLRDGTLVKYFGPGVKGWQAGDEVDLSFPVEHIYLFDRESEARLWGGEPT